MKHPLQPSYIDEHGTRRFKPNALVKFLLDKGPFTMNDFAIGFSDEDQEQFAQLIGYSVSGFGDLPYANHDTVAAADLMGDTGMTETEARLHNATDLINRLRIALGPIAADLFGVHPDDLGGSE